MRISKLTTVVHGASGVLLGLAFLSAGCKGSSSGSSNSSSSTAAATSATTATTPVSPLPSPAASPVAPAPSPSPAALVPSNWLYVANQGSDTITTFALDPLAGSPSHANDTAIIPAAPTPGAAVFHVNTIAVDPTNSVLFAAGYTTAAIYPPSTSSGILPIALALGTLTPGTFTVGGSASSGQVLIDPTSSCAFTLDTGGGVTPAGTTPAGGITSFTYGAGGTALAQGISVAFGTLGAPTAAVIDPAGVFLYAVDSADMTLSALGIDSGGFVAGTNPPVLTSSVGALSITLDPLGTTLVTGNSDGTVSIYSLGAAGVATLALPGTSVEPAGFTPASASVAPSVLSVAIDPTGTYLVTANGASNDVSLIQLANASPAATGPLVGAPYAYPGLTAGATATPASVIWNANGTTVYVANSTANTISALQVSATGLTPLAGSPFALPAGDTTPASLAVSQ